MPRKRKQPQARGSSGNCFSSQNNNNGPVVPSGKPVGNETYRNGQISRSVLKKRGEHRKDCADQRSSDLIFPGCTPWVVFLVTLLGRVVYVSQTKNWWILHPDEVFQSVEGKGII